jgi:hypothetical protein
MNPLWLLPVFGTVIVAVIAFLGLVFQIGEYEASEYLSDPRQED